MSNQYFQFKQFRIAQDRCAMKVTTDACIQGAWTPIQPGVKHVLDIGAGTGLLSLMLAQRNNDIHIDAIELDKDAVNQAAENVEASVWKKRINVIAGDVCDHVFPHTYDLIISNPPFFNNSLLSNDVSKDKARHTLSLTYTQLVLAVDTNLNAEGCVSVLLPYNEYQLLSAVFEASGYNEINKLQIKHSADAPVKRVVGAFSKTAPVRNKECTLIIKNDEQNYTQEFIELLAPFYLNL